MFKKNTRNNIHTNKSSKPSNGFDWNSASDKVCNYFELNRIAPTFYAIGKDRESGKQTVLDYQSKFRSEAEAYFDMEFNAMNADVTYMGTYQ